MLAEEHVYGSTVEEVLTSACRAPAAWKDLAEWRLAKDTLRKMKEKRAPALKTEIVQVLADCCIKMGAERYRQTIQMSDVCPRLDRISVLVNYSRMVLDSLSEVESPGSVIGRKRRKD